MTQISQDLKPVEAIHTRGGTSLPWWTWVVPFLVADLGSWLSLWLKTGPGVALWYFPTAFGILMSYWWGPRVLLGVYLNAVIFAPLWDLPWQASFLYALPETIEVGLSWFLFVKLLRGKVWLPDLGNIGKFLLFGSIIPTGLTNIYLVWQLLYFGDIASGDLWDNWRILFSGDVATQFAFTVPVLIVWTKYVTDRGWTLVEETISQHPVLPENRNSLSDKLLILGIFVSLFALSAMFPVEELWVFYGFILVVLGTRYGIYVASFGVSWIGTLTFLSPVIKTGSIIGTTDFLITNLGILLLSGVALVTGRAISDLALEIQKQKQSEDSLRNAESRYRSLTEQIPPIIYTSGPNQHIGVEYISPRIEALGFTQTEWLADPELWFRQIHPEDQPGILKAIEEIKISGEPFHEEYRIFTRDGKLLWFLDEAIDVVDHADNLIYRQGFMLDITARKLAEERTASREKFLALLNDMTRTILASTDFDSTIQRLAFDLKRVIDADDCYILYWDEEKQVPIPMTTTASLDFDYSKVVFKDGEKTISGETIQTGHVLAIDDVPSSSYVSKQISSQYPVRSAIGIPLIVGEHKLGTVLFAFREPHKFTDNEIQRAEQAGDQMALAFWEFQQSAEIQRRLRESNALAKIGLALSETERGGIDSVLKLIVDSALDLIKGAQESVIHLLDIEEQVLIPKAASGFQTDETRANRPKMRLGEGVAGYVMRNGETINVDDIMDSELFIIKGKKPSFRSLLVAPIRSGGQQIGTISVQSEKVNAFSRQDVNLINTFSVQATIAIENTRLFEATQQSLREANALYRTSQGLASLDTDELIEDVVNLLQKNFDYYHAQIYLLDPSTHRLVLKSGSGEIGRQLLEEKHSLPMGEGIVGHVADTGAPFFANDVNDVVFFYRNHLLPNTHSELAVPIIMNNQVMGVLDIQHEALRRLTNNDMQLMVTVAGQLSVALQRANLYENLEYALNQEETTRKQLIQSERLALVGRLLASVSHELNNPLQAIQNALFLIKDEEQLSEQGKKDLAVILAEAERMASLIERLRSAYRPGLAKDFKPLQFNSLIEKVYALITTHMRQKEISFEFHPETGLPQVDGASDQLHQVMLNLMLNGIEVMNPGGRLMVWTRHLPGQNEILITVKDTGPGISPEILPNIFDAFVTDKPSGTGLGLAISRDIIEQHSGRIEATNDPDGGAYFNIWLPIHNGGN